MALRRWCIFTFLRQIKGLNDIVRQWMVEGYFISKDWLSKMRDSIKNVESNELVDSIKNYEKTLSEINNNLNSQVKRIPISIPRKISDKKTREMVDTESSNDIMDLVKGVALLANRNWANDYFEIVKRLIKCTGISTANHST